MLTNFLNLLKKKIASDALNPTRLLRQEIGLIPNGCQAFCDGEVVVDLIPVSGMTHVRKIEPFVSDVCHPCEPEFECGRQRMRAGGGVSGAKVEIALVPPSPNIDDIIHFRVRGRRFDVCGLEMFLDKLIGF